MRTKLSFILLTIIISTALYAQTAVAPSGSGTGGDPYLIALLENLCWMTQDSSSLGSYFKQAVDIDAFTTSGWNDRKGFSPIGNLGSPFIGSYDGDGHTVSGIFISRPSDEMVGAFGYVSGSGVVENIGAISVNINGIILLVAL